MGPLGVVLVDPAGQGARGARRWTGRAGRRPTRASRVLMNRSALPLVWGRCGRVRLWRAPIASTRRRRSPSCRPRRCRSGRARSGRRGSANQTAASSRAWLALARALVGHVGDIGEPGVVVDDDLEVVVARTRASSVVRGARRPAEEPVAAAVGDPAELLVVLVDERARVVVDVADRHARQAIGVAQPGVAGPGEDGIHGRAGLAEQRAEPMRAPAPFDPAAEDRLDDLGPGQPGRAVGSRAAVLETGPALGPIPTDPLVGGRRLTPWASAALATGQPSSSIRVTRSCRPKTLRRAVRWAMRASSTLGC